jgi:hypothetical protein
VVAWRGVGEDDRDEGLPGPSPAPRRVPRPCVNLSWHHNHMALKKTTVMVDENDLAIIKEAAKRDGKPRVRILQGGFPFGRFESHTP